MRIDSYQNNRNPHSKQKGSSAISVNGKKNQNRKLKRIDYQRQLEKNLESKPGVGKRTKMGINHFKDRIVSIMAGVIIIFILIFSLVWVVTK